jgi:AcrR family transcriptional regulator
LSTCRGRPQRADAVRNRELALAAATALLAEPDAVLTVEAIAHAAGLGAATVVRAFGGKDALVDAAVAALLEPMVGRARDLLHSAPPAQALRTFLGELIAFQSVHHPISNQLGGLDLPATTALRAALVRAMEEMIAAARQDGTIRADLDPVVAGVVIGETAYAIARARPTGEVTDTYLTILLDGLRPPAR